MSSGSRTFSSSMALAHNYNRWVVRAFRPYIGRSVLEVGIGHGGLHDYLPPGTAYAGLDIDRELVDAARVRRPDLEYIVADVAEPGLPATLSDRSFDTLLCVNVLEHVPDEAAGVANMLDVLPTGGHLLLFVPAFRGLFTDLDRLAGHLRRYTRRQVASLFPESKADPVLVRYFNPIGGVGWWLNRFVSHSSLETKRVNREVALFDRYFLPLSRTLDPMTRRVFGQSVLCVVKRK